MSVVHIMILYIHTHPNIIQNLGHHIRSIAHENDI